MVQVASGRKREQAEDAEVRFEDAIRIVDELPPTMLPKLISHVLNTLTRRLEENQLSSDAGMALSSTAEPIPTNEKVQQIRLQATRQATALGVQRRASRNTREVRDRGLLEDALGLLATDKPAPDDDEVQRIIDEYRREKYG